MPAHMNYDQPETFMRYIPIKDPPAQTREHMVERALLIKQLRLGMDGDQFKVWLKGSEARIWAGTMGFVPEWKGWLA